MKSVCVLLLIFLIPAVAYPLTIEQADSVRATLKASPIPELPFTAGKLIDEAAPDSAQVRVIIVKWVAANRPGALAAVLPAVNRPPYTPGNDHGNRPIVPPGLDKRDYGRP